MAIAPSKLGGFVPRHGESAFSTAERRLIWALSIINGLLAIAAVDAVYTALSSPGIWLVPLWLAAPYGAFTGWRASVYIRELLRGAPNHSRPAFEGFALLALTVMGNGLWLALRAGFGGANIIRAMFAWAFYAIVVGGFGAAVAIALMALDGEVVRIFVSKRSTAG